MVTNKDLQINLVSRKYPKNIQDLIKRFRRPYPTGVDYIRRLDKEYDIIRDKGFVDTFQRVSDIIDLIKQKIYLTFYVVQLHHHSYVISSVYRILTQ